jgi:BMFP domain-containing protein YqiC
MSNIFEKAILIAAGVEKKLKELICELEEKGKEEKKAPSEELPPGKRLENRIVEDATKAVNELLALLREGKTKIEAEAEKAAGAVMQKMGVATKEELEVVKEMARVAREKVDKLEKQFESRKG